MRAACGGAATDDWEERSAAERSWKKCHGSYRPRYHRWHERFWMVHDLARDGGAAGRANDWRRAGRAEPGSARVSRGRVSVARLAGGGAGAPGLWVDRP